MTALIHVNYKECQMCLKSHKLRLFQHVNVHASPESQKITDSKLSKRIYGKHTLHMLHNIKFCCI